MLTSGIDLLNFKGKKKKFKNKKKVKDTIKK